MKKLYRISALICMLTLIAPYVQLPVYAESNTGYNIDMSKNFVKDKFVKAIGTRQHKRLSNSIRPDILFKDKRNKIQLIYNPSSGNLRKAFLRQQAVK